MPNIQNIDPALIVAHTTTASQSIMHWVSQHYGINVHECHLIRRGLNDNYQITSASGVRYIARMYSLRPRGMFNVDFETSLLIHLEAKGVGVAAPISTSNGQKHIFIEFPEGVRALAVFHHIDGAVPETPQDFELTGRELAHIHQASRDYAGPSSLYNLDGAFLSSRTLVYLGSHPTIEKELLDKYCLHENRLLEELRNIESSLSRVLCHGDTHGFNNHIYQNASGSTKTAFFDFDDAGPGFLSYDLAIMPWSYLFRKGLTKPDEILCKRWEKYIGAYKNAGGKVSAGDVEAIGIFLQLRHFWNIGEAIGRMHHWGTSVFSLDWLRKQPDIMEAWGEIKLDA